jgi:hypothetical protein
MDIMYLYACKLENTVDQWFLNFTVTEHENTAYSYILKLNSLHEILYITTKTSTYVVTFH